MTGARVLVGIDGVDRSRGAGLLAGSQVAS